MHPYIPYSAWQVFVCNPIIRLWVGAEAEAVVLSFSFILQVSRPSSASVSAVAHQRVLLTHIPHKIYLAWPSHASCQFFPTHNVCVLFLISSARNSEQIMQNKNSGRRLLWTHVLCSFLLISCDRFWLPLLELLYHLIVL